jgi:putative ubiquitin-RnfH superfamily antitoxin RatB of RatAB toxin-antitoxin module
MPSLNALNRCMAEKSTSTSISITLATSPAPGQVCERVLHLPTGTRAAQVLAQYALETALCGIWGRVVAPDQLLHEGDRLELYRPLTVDPKVARRERFARQGARTTGLFARQRPGGKAGY